MQSRAGHYRKVDRVMPGSKLKQKFGFCYPSLSASFGAIGKVVALSAAEGAMEKKTQLASGTQAISGKGVTALSAAQERRLRQSLRRHAPSEPWVEAQIQTIEHVDANGGVR